MTSTDSLPATSSAEKHPLTIEGMTEPVVLRYFETFNASDFEATAELFAPNGQLNAPFEEPIEGPTAIAAYLQAEARGMILYPRQAIVEALEENQTQIQVSGKVQTPVFGVNVSWKFILSAEQKILSTTIKLLASPQELLNLRR